METTIGNNNASLWQHVKPENSVPEFMRGILANRLVFIRAELTTQFKCVGKKSYFKAKRNFYPSE